MASGPASHVKPVTKQTFGSASPGAAREAAPEALPNGALVKLSSWSTRGAWRVLVITPYWDFLFQKESITHYDANVLKSFRACRKIHVET